MPKRIEVYFDGSCKPINPGGYGGAGFLILDGPETIKRSFHIGHGPSISSNLAEHYAITEALKCLLEIKLEGERIEVYGDSTLVINQMKGNWGIYRGLYVYQARESLKYACKFKNISFEWISRDMNYEADYLADRAADDRDEYTGT